MDAVEIAVIVRWTMTTHTCTKREASVLYTHHNPPKKTYETDEPSLTAAGDSNSGCSAYNVFISVETPTWCGTKATRITKTTRD